MPVPNATRMRLRASTARGRDRRLMACVGSRSVLARRGSGALGHRGGAAHDDKGTLARIAERGEKRPAADAVVRAEGAHYGGEEWLVLAQPQSLGGA